MTADDLLTAVAGTAPDYRATLLGVQPLNLLREAADLCLVGDADVLTRKEAIAAILANF